MAIVHRRVFFAKVGQAGPLVQHFQEVDKSMRQYGVDFKARILTDHLSGRSDRVAIEWEVENLEEIDASLGRLMGSPEGQAYFGKWLEKLNDLVLYSEADNWHVQ